MEYDLIIVGAGPAGLSAGLYASRAGMNTIIFEKAIVGGQMAQTLEIENYPGFTESDAFQLVEKMKNQTTNFGAKIILKEVTKIDFKKRIIYTSNDKYKTKAIILATGSQPRKLGIKGEIEFAGRGVSYCATCDGAFFRDLNIAVIGGGNSAVEEAVFLTRFAKKVYIVHRRDNLRATKIEQEKAFKNDKIKMVWNSTPKEIKGDDAVKELVIENTISKKNSILKVDGVFFYVGLLANSQLADKNIKKDKTGFILSDASMKTKIEGVFVAGDVISKTLRQVVTAVSDGATAAVEAEKYLGLTYR